MHYYAKTQAAPEVAHHPLPNSITGQSHQVHFAIFRRWDFDSCLARAHYWLEHAGTHNVVFAQTCQIYPSRRCKGRPRSGQHQHFVKAPSDIC